MPDIDESSERFGSLTAKIDQILDGQKYDRIVRGEMVNQIQAISADHERINRMEALVTIHEQWRQRGIGVILFFSAVGGIIGAALAVLAERLLGNR